MSAKHNVIIEMIDDANRELNHLDQDCIREKLPSGNRLSHLVLFHLRKTLQEGGLTGIETIVRLCVQAERDRFKDLNFNQRWHRAQARLDELTQAEEASPHFKATKQEMDLVRSMIVSPFSSREKMISHADEHLARVESLLNLLS